MIGELTAAGDAASGALAARAVEPRAGEGGHGAAPPLCLNCGTRLIGEHCHRCGQSGHVHRTVGAIGHELAHGVLHFEGKIWRTLPLLAFRPGELTRRYVGGERARFLSPLALFLFSVFLMFAVVASLPGTGFGGMDKAFDRASLEEARAKVAEERLKVQADIADKRRSIAYERRDATPDQGRVARMEAEIAELVRNDGTLANAQRFLPAPDGEDEVQLKTSNSWFDAKWRQAKANPKLLLYKVKTSAYKYSWALIPMSLPFIWLLFPLRRDVGLYDHAVFATYSLSFMSLFAILVASAAAAGLRGGPLNSALLLIPPLHLYKQIKGAYGLRRLGALWRTAWMLVFALFTSIAFILLLLTMGMSD